MGCEILLKTLFYVVKYVIAMIEFLPIAIIYRANPSSAVTVLLLAKMRIVNQETRINT